MKKQQKNIKQRSKLKTKNLQKTSFTNEFKHWIEDKFQSNKKYFLIDHCKLRFTYHDVNINHDDGQAVFQIDSNIKYHSSVVYIYPLAQKMFDDKLYEEIDRGIVHEITHVHTARISEISMNRFVSKKEVRDEIENLTDIMSEYIYRYINLQKKTNKLTN
jgi:hypothetical protein